MKVGCTAHVLHILHFLHFQMMCFGRNGSIFFRIKAEIPNASEVEAEGIALAARRLETLVRVALWERLLLRQSRECVSAAALNHSERMNTL